MKLHLIYSGSISKHVLWIGCFMFAGAWTNTALGQQGNKMNVIFYLIDDLGWADLGCYGNTYHQTPAIDQLAKEGMRFTDAYATAICSPTRASIMTGKTPARTLITNWVPAGRWSREGHLLKEGRHLKTLPLEEFTLAEALQAHGYATALIGKWHLGGIPFGNPEQHGFEVNKGGDNFGSPGNYFYPYEGSWLVPTTNHFAKFRTFDDGAEGEYLTDRLTQEAEEFIRQNQEKPFFLYLSHFAVHSPYQAKPDKVEKYSSTPEQKRQSIPEYAAMLESVDESIGRINNLLKELNLDKKTLIIFYSDNGGSFYPTINGPLRGWKGSHYEGGIRVPLIIKWPGQIKEGGISNTPVICTDFYPTILDVLELPPLPHQHADGMSLVPLLKGTGNLEREALYWHSPHYNVHPYSAPGAVIRMGEWKLMEFFEDRPSELYNLSKDLGEHHNLIDEYPKLALQLSQKIKNWQVKLDAEMMSPNPDYKYPTTGLYGAQIQPSRNDKGQLMFSIKRKYYSFKLYYTFDEKDPDDSCSLYEYGERITVPDDAKTLKVITYQNKKNTGFIVRMTREEMEARIQ